MGMVCARIDVIVCAMADSGLPPAKIAELADVNVNIVYRMRKGYPNLISNKERSPSELREMGRKGGIKSGEVRRKKRDMKKAAAIWLAVFDELEKQGMSMEEITKKLMAILRK